MWVKLVAMLVSFCKAGAVTFGNAMCAAAIVQAETFRPLLQSCNQVVKQSALQGLLLCSQQLELRQVRRR